MIRIYLVHCNTFILLRFQAATPKQLWEAFEDVLYDNEFYLGDDLTITQFMKSWTEQPGYPLVKIVKENNTFVISQVGYDLIIINCS